MSIDIQNTFLSEMLEKLMLKYPSNFSQLCIITPNRRAQVFIKNYLKESGKPMMIPTLFSIEDFIQHLSPYTIFDNVDLTFEFYEVYKHLEGENAQDFETFLQWAAVLINDFNEIDMHLGDANALFSHLSDDYAIREWNLGIKDLSDFQKNYLAFFHKLNDYYQYFTQKILSQQAAYSGLAYRYVAENLLDLINKQPWDKLVFAGFNALTLSEEKIIRSLYEAKKADIIWDVDDYYFSNKNQEAGLFLKKYATWFKFDKELISAHFKQPKKVQVIAVPRGIGQAKIAAELLLGKAQSATSISQGLSNTALVLADENLLMPTLNSLDDYILEETNVTMGYPLKNTAAHLLLRLFFKMQFMGQRQQKLKSQSGVRFLNEDLIQLLKNPIIEAFFGSHLEFVKRLKKQLYWTAYELQSLAQQTNVDLAFLFTDFENSAAVAIRFFQDLIAKFTREYQQSDENKRLKYSSDWEAFKLYDQILNRLLSRIEVYGYPNNLQEFKIIFEQLIGNESQAFHGEPLKGLQLMGLLETRVLDFENLIILSVNEDILPSGRMSNSFIPVDIKRLFNLPTYTEKNAIFAYHFYRLLQRAKHVTLLYSTTAGKLQGGEKSRFITQLVLELRDYNPEAIIQEQLFNFNEIHPNNRLQISIEKDLDIQEKLAFMAKDGFSPTAINTYISCPLKFYFKHILKIREPEEEQNFIDDRMLGNIIHHCFETMYLPFVGKNITPSDISILEKSIKQEVENEAKKEVQGQLLDSGQNLLTLKAIERYISQFLKFEKKETELNLKKGGSLSLIGLEQKLERELVLSDSNSLIKIKGIADRIDIWNRSIRVLDYKSGAVDAKNLKRIPFDTLFTDTKNDKAVQLLTYAWMLQDQYPNTALQSGIIALRNINEPYAFLNNAEDNVISDANLETFENTLREFFTRIFNENLPFEQTEEKKNCQYCPYINICLK